MGQKAAKKRSTDSVNESVAMQQNSAVGILPRKRGNLGAVSVQQFSFVIPSSTASHLSFAGGASTSSTLYTSVKGRAPNQFAFLSQRTMLTMNMDIRKSNNATVEIAIADFFHCENPPDLASSCQDYYVSSKFATLLANILWSCIKRIGGKLLDLNYMNTYEHNKDKLLKKVKVFGLAFMGDGAMIHQIPLQNILAMSGVTPPITISIQDCLKHMVEGGKKDTLYIADLFKENVAEFNPERMYTDVFYFDGASNVEKAGNILIARFPRSFCFHGGEHVVLLFFSWIAKIKTIKISYMLRALSERSLMARSAIPFWKCALTPQKVSCCLFWWHACWNVLSANQPLLQW
jgi:hypothetical protein